MDVVGGVIVAAGDHDEDRRGGSARSGARAKRARYGEPKAAGAVFLEDPAGWNFSSHGHHRRGGVGVGAVKKPSSLPGTAPAFGGGPPDHHEDYELRSVLGLYRPGNHPASANFLTKPILARAWVDPLRFLLKKELTVTDVGDLGRIILPKRDAECQLPHLDSKEGKLLNMEDYNSNKNWTLRYKWWPNNKSRMYVLESTGEFVKYYDLKEKDELIVYKDGVGNLVIRGQKHSSSPPKFESLLGTSSMKGILPTGKRSPKGAHSRSHLSKLGHSSSSSTVSASSSGETLTASSTTTTSVAMLTTSVLSTTSVFSTTSSYADPEMGSLAPSVGPPMGATIGALSIGPYGAVVVQTDHGACIDWEKLPDPPAIEFSDPPAMEFPDEFGCTWGDCL